MTSEVDELVGDALHDGRYAVSGVLGAGSQGATLEAVDKMDGRLVAIKRFQVRGARSWKDVELAEREARVLNKLTHPLAPRALDYFEEDGALYLVMEKIEGPTLRELGTVSRAEVVDFLHDAADVLDYLHGRAPPVIHRDIKPGNVIRRQSDDGTMQHVLVDFGSVRDTLKPAGGSTVVGTFGYMAPEQLQGRALACTDVYAVGATALRMLTGIEPEHMPHKGLAIDVEAALGERDTPLARALAAMVEPDPDRRASAIGPLLPALQQDGDVLKEERKAERTQRRHEHRRQRREDKRQRRRQRRAERRRDRPPLPFVIRELFLVGLGIAQVAVAVALHVVVPTVLTLLSLVFGRGLRTASKHVHEAGRVARSAIQDAMQAVRRSGTETAARIDADDEPRMRIADEPSDDEAVADAVREPEQVAEEAIAEAERKLKR